MVIVFFYDEAITGLLMSLTPRLLRFARKDSNKFFTYLHR